MNNNEGREKNKYLLGMNHTQENTSHSKEDIDYKIEKLKEKKNEKQLKMIMILMVIKISN